MYLVGFSAANRIFDIISHINIHLNSMLVYNSTGLPHPFTALMFVLLCQKQFLNYVCTDSENHHNWFWINRFSHILWVMNVLYDHIKLLFSCWVFSVQLTSIACLSVLGRRSPPLWFFRRFLNSLHVRVFLSSSSAGSVVKTIIRGITSCHSLYLELLILAYTKTWFDLKLVEKSQDFQFAALVNVN